MSMIDREYEEKRDFIRMFVDAVVEITDPDTGKTVHGESKNLSAGGVAFTTDQAFSVGKKLSVQVSSLQSQLPPLTADFIVVRVKDKPDNHYEIAGKLENVR